MKATKEQMELALRRAAGEVWVNPTPADWQPPKSTKPHLSESAQYAPCKTPRKPHKATVDTPERCISGGHLKWTKQVWEERTRLRHVQRYLRREIRKALKHNEDPINTMGYLYAWKFVEDTYKEQFKVYICHCPSEMETGKLVKDPIVSEVYLEKRLRKSRALRAPYTGIVITSPNLETTKLVLALKPTRDKSIVVGKNGEHPFPEVQPKPTDKTVLVRWQELRRQLGEIDQSQGQTLYAWLKERDEELSLQAMGYPPTTKRTANKAETKAIKDELKQIEQDYESALPLELWLREIRKLTWKGSQDDAEEKTVQGVRRKQTAKFMSTFLTYDTRLLTSEPYPFEKMGEPAVYSPEWRADRFSEKEEEPLFAVDHRITNHFVLQEVIRENLETYRAGVERARLVVPIAREESKDNGLYRIPARCSPEEPKKTDPWISPWLEKLDYTLPDNDPFCIVNSVVGLRGQHKTKAIGYASEAELTREVKLEPLYPAIKIVEIIESILKTSKWEQIWQQVYTQRSLLQPQQEKVWGWSLDYPYLYVAPPAEPAEPVRIEHQLYGQELFGTPGDVVLWRNGGKIFITKQNKNGHRGKTPVVLYLSSSPFGPLPKYFSGKQEAMEHCKKEAKKTFRIRNRKVRGIKGKQRDLEGWMQWNVRYCALYYGEKLNDHVKEVHKYNGEVSFQGRIRCNVGDVSFAVCYAPKMRYPYPLIGWSDKFTGNSEDVFDKDSRIALEVDPEEVLRAMHGETESEPEVGDSEATAQEAIELAEEVLEVWDAPEEEV